MRPYTPDEAKEFLRQRREIVTLYDEELDRLEAEITRVQKARDRAVADFTVKLDKEHP